MDCDLGWREAAPSWDAIPRHNWESPTMPNTIAEETVAELVESVRPIVEAIEASTPLTRSHYDQYLAAIAHIAEGLPRFTRPRMIAAALLIKAGADPRGVLDALTLGEGQHPHRLGEPND